MVSRWGISDTHGGVARALIGACAKDKTTTGAKHPPPFDKRQEYVHSDVIHIVTERFVHLVHTEGILVCWACAVPVVIQVVAKASRDNTSQRSQPLEVRDFVANVAIKLTATMATRCDPRLALRRRHTVYMDE